MPKNSKPGWFGWFRISSFSPDYIQRSGLGLSRGLFRARSRRGKTVKIEKPWRTYMRLTTIIPQGRGKELNNVRNAVITNLVGKTHGRPEVAALRARRAGMGPAWRRELILQAAAR